MPCRLPALLAIAFSTCLHGATPIRHVIIIVQENRSFDQYFGKYPGADGLRPGTCVPLDPARPRLGCIVPFHDVHDINGGGPHMAVDAMDDLANGLAARK
ncbi:MAG: alkaline phosphatase family protein [Rhodospirillales bacterium]